MTFQLNGREARGMTTPAPQKPDEGSGQKMFLFSLRLWILCALIIVACGVGNYLLNWFVGR